ncbi:PQQ-binding-like beta-propeller repeat protein [Streptomyces sp. NPDC017254]|uniref:outer membrane protein assembly factor BamB family protein n=1 Tax=unclassified Streptomyces TaxID=2593676 RepID=UPI0037B24E19
MAQHQPWYGDRTPQRPVPQNPYAPEGYGTPPPPPRRFRAAPLIAAVLAFLVLAGVGAYVVVTRDGGDRAAPPAAGPSASPKRTTPPPKTGPPTRAPQHVPTTEEINAARKPGDARAWVVDDTTDLPRGYNSFEDLWTVGDLVVQAAYRKVSAYRISDGTEVWSLPLPAPVCETPAHPTPDGKVVLVYKSSQARNGNRCNQLQMIDLRAGKAGWHKKLTETGSADDTIIVHTAISGGTLAVVQSLKATAYRVGDGAKLYDIPMEDPGKCHPVDVAGGVRLLVKSDCALSASVDRRNYGQIREIDPRTGRVRWRFRTEPGWKPGSVFSVDPLVISTGKVENPSENWRVVALGPDGRARRTIDARAKGFQHCANTGWGAEFQSCPGVVAGDGMVVLGGIDRVGGYDLTTGKLLWGVKAGDSDAVLYPLRTEPGKKALVYEAATWDQPGLVSRLGPGGVDTRKEVQRHPGSARSTESRMLAGWVVYAHGRLVVTPSGVTGDDGDHQARMLSFGP